MTVTVDADAVLHHGQVALHTVLPEPVVLPKLRVVGVHVQLHGLKGDLNKLILS